MQKLKNTILSLFFILLAISSFSQEGTGKSGFGSTMRSDGRIYVVVAVVLTILAGLILYLVRLDRKISKLEKEN